MRTPWILTLSLLAGCPYGFYGDDMMFAQTSPVSNATDGARLAWADGRTLLVADTDRGELTVVRDDVVVQRLELGDEPTHVAATRRAAWVTLRGSGEVVRIVRENDLPTTRWTVHARRDVGPEPFDVALVGDHLWVAVSQSDEVLRLDPETLEVRDRVAVPGEPRWLGGDPRGAGVWVAGAQTTTITFVDPFGVLETRHLPEERRFLDESCGDRPLAARVTGDLAVTADGAVIVPALYVDPNIAADAAGIAHARGEGEPEPPKDPPPSGDTAPPSDTAPPAPPGSDTAAPPPPPEEATPPHCLPPVAPPQLPPPSQYYAGAAALQANSVDRFNPALAILSAPGRMDRDVAMLVTTRATNDEPTVHRSYLSSVAISGRAGDGAVDVVVTMEGSDHVLHLPLLRTDMTDLPEGMVSGSMPSSPTPGAPSSAAISPAGRLAVWSFVDRRVHTWERAEQVGSGTATSLGADLDATDLPEDVLRGRRLFYSATDPAITSPGAGVSCATCHADGRTDGVTWRLPFGLRNTPSLAGTVSQTLPLTWEGTVDSIADEVLATSQLRMGGSQLSRADATDVAAWVDHVRDVRRPTLDDDLVTEGRRLFRDPTVGCATCHAGTLGTDNRVHDVLGFEQATQTPPLKGVAASGPWLHDGSAKTLREVLERASDGSMGDTSALTDHQLAALEAYLRSW